MQEQSRDNYWNCGRVQRLTRRRLLKTSAVAGSALTVFGAACRSTGQPSGGSAAGSGTSGQAKAGGHLRHIVPYSAANIDPHTTDDATGYGFIEGYWYEPLVNVDYSNPNVDWRAANKSVPWLSDKIEQPDPTTYLFSIRQGVKWHNGDPFSVDDVVFSFKRMMTPNSGINATTQGFVAHIDSVTAVDDRTVKITAKQPDADFLIYLGQRTTPMVPAKVLQSGQSLNKQAIGTGPFRLASYMKDGSAEANRFESYWQQGRPYLDGVRMTLLADDGTMAAAFIAGQTDIITRTDKKQADPLKQANPKAKSRSFLEEQIQGIMFNEAKAPFNDLRVRQAVHLAIDRQEANKAVYFSEGQISGPVVVAGKTGRLRHDHDYRGQYVGSREYGEHSFLFEGSLRQGRRDQRCNTGQADR